MRTLSPFRVLLAGIVAMAVSNGIGRFAYTPLLPPMQAALGFSDLWAGLLAAANHLGYLVGALAAMRVGESGGGVVGGRRRAMGLSLLVCVFGTLLLPGTEAGAWHALMRFLAGLGGAMAFVLASAMVLGRLAVAGKSGWGGLLFGGVGVGIAVTGVLTPLLVPWVGWQGGWVALGVLGGMAGWLVWPTLKQVSTPASAPEPHAPPPPVPADRPQGLTLALVGWLYFAFGVGYIVSGTFLVSLAGDTLGGQWGNSAWVLVGVATFPSSLVWSLVAARVGFGIAWALSMALLGVGILVPCLSGAPWAVLLSGGLFGGTFMGVAGLAMALGRILTPESPQRGIGLLTAAFGVGQMIGPAIAGGIATVAGSMLPALAGSGILVLAAAGVIAVVVGRHLMREHSAPPAA